MSLATKKLYYILLRNGFVSPTKYYNVNATMDVSCIFAPSNFARMIRKYRTCIEFFKVIKKEAIDVYFHLLKMFPKIGRYSE